jgi:hypothetical protein
MARTEIAISSLAQNEGSAVTATVVPAGATGTAGYVLTGAKKDVTVLIENSGSATGVFSIKAGDYCNASQGDLTVTVGVGVSKAIQLDGARFRTEAGAYNVDCGTTGIISATQAA